MARSKPQTKAHRQFVRQGIIPANQADKQALLTAETIQSSRFPNALSNFRQPQIIINQHICRDSSETGVFE